VVRLTVVKAALSKIIELLDSSTEASTKLPFLKSTNPIFTLPEGLCKLASLPVGYRLLAFKVFLTLAM
jgi:hypothetical protein